MIQMGFIRRSIPVLCTLFTLAVSALVLSTSTSAAPSTSCNLHDVRILENKAASDATAQDLRARSAMGEYARAAAMLMDCATSASPPMARWKLELLALEDEASKVRLAFANADDFDIQTGRRSLEYINAMIYSEPTAPAGAHAAALQRFNDLCLRGVPQYNLAYARTSCSTYIKVLARPDPPEGGDGFGWRTTPTSDETSSPTPSIVYGGSKLCPRPNAPAGVDRAVEPEMPAGASYMPTGRVTVLVSLNERSEITNLQVSESSHPIFDDAALAAARQSKFHTALRSCKPIPGTYEFVVTFDNQ